jgi:sulfur-oxidizing protein SoxZ
MTEPIRIRARSRGDVTEVLVLMPHPMETGLRNDDKGTAVPAHYITSVRVSVADRTVLDARMSIAIAQDPLLGFRFRGGRAGDRIRVTWTDNTGATRSDESTIA